MTKKQKVKIAFSFCYNSYVFKFADFMNYMSNCAFVCWEIAPKQIFKNGHEFESEWTKAFIEQYGGQTSIKQQANTDG